jgi:hypothetical protein
MGSEFFVLLVLVYGRLLSFLVTITNPAHSCGAIVVWVGESRNVIPMVEQLLEAREETGC